MAGLQARAGGATITPPLPQAAGYVVVVVLGLVVAVGMFPLSLVVWMQYTDGPAMMYVTKVLKNTTGEDNKRTEMFMTANRTVRTGLTASAVISSWLWTTAILGSSFTGYDYGVSGPFWFAAGCSPMIVFFALLGISCKRKIPEAHTSLELVRIRYGRIAHLVFMVLCLVNNIFASANMLLGAAAVIAAVSGMHIIAATFLVPVGVAVYTFVGGIKATFLTDYFHTVVILAIACYFSVKAFQNNDIGSVGDLYDLIQTAAQLHPVSGNSQGSYLTMNSKSGILFGILHTCSNFGLVIMDTSYFIKSFSATPSAVVPGYTIGGILYFSIPWGLGTVMSSLAIGLENHPSFPTYPRRMTSSEVSGGLVLPYAAIAIAGKGGATAVLLMTFMAVTSTLSAQVIAVSSILSFDVYRLYFKPHASDRDIIRASHVGVLFFAAFAAGFSTMLHYVGIDLGWTLYMLGVVTCPGVFPMVFTVLWRHQNKAAAIFAPILGICTGIGVWLGTAYRFYGSVSVSATGGLLPCVYGTVSSALSPILYSAIITAFKPQNYDWSNFQNEKLALEKLENDLTTVHSEGAPHKDNGKDYAHAQQSPEAVTHGQHHHEKQQEAEEQPTPDPRIAQNPEEGHSRAALDAKELKRWGRIAAFWSAATFLGHWVIWPLPMYGSKYVFDKNFYYAWVVVAIIWLWFTTMVATFYPIVDGGWQQIRQVVGAWRRNRQAQGQGVDEVVPASPPSPESVGVEPKEEK